MKKEKTKLNEIESKVLYYLDLNSSSTLSSVARKVGISPQRLEFIISKLEKNKIIKKYIPVIDYSKFSNYFIYFYLIKLTRCSYEEEEKLLEKICENKNCIFVYKLDGEYDLFFGVMAKELEEAYGIINKILKDFGQKILRKSFGIISNIYLFPRRYLLNICEEKESEELFYEKARKEHIIIGLSKEKVKLGPEEIDILKILSSDSKTKVNQIGKILKINPQTVWYKIRKLTDKKIIPSFTILLDPQKYDHLFYFFDITTTAADENIIENLKNECKKFENLFRILSLMEKDRLIVLAVFRSEEEKLSFINFLKQKSKEEIKEIKSYRVSEIYKFKYFIDF
ncbi:MAG: Lrp/AsnC family transcriptional regulator [Candidatus Anstonellaceae archaeon]